MDKIGRTKISYVIIWKDLVKTPTVQDIEIATDSPVFWIRLPLPKLLLSSLVLASNYPLSPMDIEVAMDLPVFGQNYLYQN